MKYLKYFESMYNVGEFIIINTNNLKLQPSENIGKIINKNKLGEFESSIIYQVELPNIPSLELKRKDIIRYAFLEEIKEYEIKKSQTKYNL